MALAVFVAHSGKTVELEAALTARVEAVQQALADLTGIPQADQILMCDGARLDAAKPLSAYNLPWDGGDGKPHDVFLYSRAHLRADAALPPPEALPDCPVDLSGLEGIRGARHRLDAAGSPLLRALPDYQRQFQEHLLQANARHQASAQRMATCARLVSEQEVQALSIDAATANVEAHYAYICTAFSAFTQRYGAQRAAHADVLARFESDLRYLAATELHPGLREGGGPATLLDLVDAGALRDGAAACACGHQHFGAKVAELEGLFAALRADVEALFMQAPSVDLEALMRQLDEMHASVDEQASIVAALSSDLAKVSQLVETAGEQLAADPAASVQVSDTVHMLETMHETHVAHLSPRVAACHDAVEAFAARCLDCKNALTRDVFSQLRTISSQQSKIREMKNKLALFREALARQEASVQDLLVVRRLPAAYKQCLAECVRREAFMSKYAHSAAQLAERMGTFREKELGMRDAFRKHVERLIPAHLLERMGLLEQPPHCQVSVSATEGERLLHITMDDVRRIQLPWGAASLLAPAGAAQPPAAAGAGDAGSGGSSREGSTAQQPGAAAEQQRQAEEAAAAAKVDGAASLQLENAKLRAELASQIALDCIRAAQTAGISGAAAAPPPTAGSGQASPQLAASAAASPRAGSSLSASTTPAASTAAAAPQLPPDAGQRFERALAAKDALVAELQAQLGGSRRQSAAYEARIQQLEAQLTAMATAADGRATAPLLAGSGLQAAAAQAAAPDSAGSSLLHSRGSASAAAASGSILGASALPASPSARQQVAPADLAASVEAAGGSSLSGYLHAAELPRSLGATASSSLAASATAVQSTEEQPAVALQPRQQAAAQHHGEEEADAAHHPAADEEVCGTSPPPPVAPLAAAAAAAQEQAAKACLPGRMSIHAAPEAAQPTLPADAEAATPAIAETADPSPAQAQPTEQPTPVEVEASTAAAAEGELPLASSAADAAQPAAGVAQAAEGAPHVPPRVPPSLVASVVVDEGSDMEGIEPVSDSEYESGEEQPTHDLAAAAAPADEALPADN